MVGNSKPDESSPRHGSTRTTGNGRQSQKSDHRSKTRTTLTVTAIFIGAVTLTITSAIGIGIGISTYIDNQIASFAAAAPLSSMKASDAAPGSQSGPAPYDPESAVVGGRFEGDGSEFASGILTAADV